MTDNQTVLAVSKLGIIYDTDAGPLETVRNVSFHINQGQVYGLVGESGSGKTTLARGVVRYLPENGRISSGKIELNGENLLDLSKNEMRSVWGKKITMVHQDPNAAVNPSIRIGEQIAEIARLHLGLNKAEGDEKALAMLEQVRMADPKAVAKRYAHQLSGGMLQRVLIAMALLTNPQLLIMDEPTTALDVTTEAVILDLIRDLLNDYNMAVLYITHNLGVVARIADRVGVMYAGELLEEGPIEDVFKSSVHPYSRGLLGCVPRLDANKEEIELYTIPGFIPRPDELPNGCIFAPRCSIAIEACSLERPTLVGTTPENNHLTACIRWDVVERELGVRTHESKEPSAALFDENSKLVLNAHDMVKHFPIEGRGLSSIFKRESSVVKAVDGINVRILDGFTLGIVGESGCGKTTLARCIAGLEEATSGTMTLQGEDLSLKLTRRPKNQLKKLQMVFQNPDASLNPQHTIGDIIGRSVKRHGNTTRNETHVRVAEMLDAVHLPEEYARRLPHELSGGEKQRVAIARAFAANPTLMICDEPISSLDVSVQASLMNLLVELQEKMGTSYLFISHDLAAIRHISDWIMVVYLGQIWEVGEASDVFKPPWHPYTEALISAIPVPDPDIHQERIRLKGSVPSAVNIPSGCRFHTRCPRKIGEICETTEPPWQDAGKFHEIRCHIPLDELIELQETTLKLS
jgi:peptide/nickel transport system ATP-binding protein